MQNDVTTNPWLLPEVADAQLALVTDQLVQDAAGNPPPPFAAFHRALRFLTPRLEDSFYFLDVGCGVGHYAHLIARHYPGIAYCGTDVSQPMIQRARTFYRAQDFRRLPDPLFMRSQFEDNRFESMDVVFVSQAIEVTEQPFENLQMVLARAKKYVLLHRMRVPRVREPSATAVERTYLGHMARNVEWNQAEVVELASEHGKVIYTDVWDLMLTIVVCK